MTDRLTTPGRSYSDLSDGATTFDPEEQFDRDVDERMKGMSKEEAVARAIANALADAYWEREEPSDEDHKKAACAAITAADKWDAEHRSRNTDIGQISTGLDSAIQDEEDHPPASIMRE